MRKINQSLQSEGYNSFKDLLSRPSNVITVGPANCDFTSPLEANTVAVSGSLILVYPDIYDLGSEKIILKDGVNWNFFPGAIIKSTSADGIFVDNNVAVTLRIDGEPKLINTGGGGMFKFDHSSSKVTCRFSGVFAINELGTTYGSFFLHSTNFPDEFLNGITVTKNSISSYTLSFPYPIDNGFRSNSFDFSKVGYESVTGAGVRIKIRIMRNQISLTIVDFQNSSFSNPSIELMDVYIPFYFNPSYNRKEISADPFS